MAGMLILLMVQILENTAFRKLAATRSAAISLVEHRRAHNICIELSGIRMPFNAIKVCKDSPGIFHMVYMRVCAFVLHRLVIPFDTCLTTIAATADNLLPCCRYNGQSQCQADVDLKTAVCLKVLPA